MLIFIYIFCTFVFYYLIREVVKKGNEWNWKTFFIVISVSIIWFPLGLSVALITIGFKLRKYLPTKIPDWL